MSNFCNFAEKFKIVDCDFFHPDSINLTWRIFFASKNRGVSPEFHFPWIYDKQNVYCVRVILGDPPLSTTVASLILRHRSLDSNRKIGLVGLVCVADDFRGRGLSSKLLQRALELAKVQKLTHLVLWTTKPEVYKKLNFKIDNTDMFGQVIKRLIRSTAVESNENAVNAHIFANVLDGPPAFAKEAVKYSTLNGTSISICRSNSIETLVDYGGPIEQVIGLIDQVMPDSWYINVPEHASIIEELGRYGYEVTLKQSSFRMIIALEDCNHPPGNIPFLDRI